MSWPLVQISEFCVTSSGGTPSRNKQEYYEGNIPWIKSGDLRENIVTEATEFITQEAVENSSAKFVNEGAILLAMYGATVGRMALLGIKATTNQAVCSIQPDAEKADTKYVYYALLDKVPEFLKLAKGGAQPNINQSMIRETEIPLPPLAEQKRIAAILDKADNLRRKRQQAIDLADEFLRAVFLDMFGDPVTNPKGWDATPLQEVSPSQPNRNVEANDDDKVWLLNLDKVESNTGRLLDKEICNYSEAGNSTSWFDDSHVLYSKLRPYLNKVVLPNDKGLATTELVPLKPNSELLTREYLTCLLRNDCFVSWANGKVAGAKMPRLSMAELRAFELPLPPLEIQKNFSKIYTATMANLEQYRESDSSQMALFNSLSQKAFSGQL